MDSAEGCARTSSTVVGPGSPFGVGKMQWPPASWGRSLGPPWTDRSRDLLIFDPITTDASANDGVTGLCDMPQLCPGLPRRDLGAPGACASGDASSSTLNL